MVPRCIQIALLGALLSPGCSTPLEQFTCASDLDCLSTSQVGGVCEDSLVCSFVDVACPSGRRYGEAAGTLSSSCVDQGEADAGGGSAIRRRSLRIDTSNLLTGPVRNFPLHVHIKADADLASTLSSSNNLRFLSGTTELPFEVTADTDLREGTLAGWLQVPNLSSDLEVVLEYGEGVTRSLPASATWDADYEGVMHCDQRDEASETMRDSTAQAIQGTPISPEASTSPGQFGHGSVGCWEFGNVFDFTDRKPFTISMWVRADQEFANGFPRLASNLGYEIERTGYSLEYSNIGNVTLTRSAAGSLQMAITETSLPVGQFTHIAGTYDSTTLRLYVDGALRVTAPDEAFMPATPNSFQLGCEAGGPDFPGMLDEVRISSIARDPSWILAQAVLGRSPQRVTLLP